MSQTLDMAVDSLLGVGTPLENKVDNNIEIREQVVKSLIQDSMDPKVANAVDKQLGAIEKTILTRERMEADKQVADDINSAVQELHDSLLLKHGEDFNVDEVLGGDVPPPPPEKRDVVFQEDYTINPDELRSGIDTEDSVITDENNT